MKDYLAVDGQYVTEIVIERSRFITTIAGIADYGEAMDFVAEIQKKYNTATHNCYAFISNAVGTEQRFSDDGEPQGTAGQPMLEVLKKKNLACTAVVVTRYFGGIKLGAGGLVSTYTKCVADATDKAVIKLNRFSDIVEIVCDYNHHNLINQQFKSLNSEVLSVDFGNNVKIVVAVPETDFMRFSERINDITQGQALIKNIEKRYHSFENN